jgi:sporulation-control protein spo0M
LQYTPGYEQLYINGVLQVRGQDYTATTGDTVTGLIALTTGDTVEIFSAIARTVADVYTQTQSDARFGIIGTSAPFRMAAGAIAFTIASGTNASNFTVTLPASRFTQAPIVSATSRVGANFDIMVNTVTVSTSSVVLRVVTNTGANTGTTITGNVDWIAVQMTSGSGAG